MCLPHPDDFKGDPPQVLWLDGHISDLDGVSKHLRDRGGGNVPVGRELRLLELRPPSQLCRNLPPLSINIVSYGVIFYLVS